MLYKHQANTTVALEVLKKFYVKEKKLYKLKVRWWNIGKCHEPWCMGIVENIEIPRDKWFGEWQLYDYTKQPKTTYMSVGLPIPQEV